MAPSFPASTERTIGTPPAGLSVEALSGEVPPRGAMLRSRPTLPGASACSWRDAHGAGGGTLIVACVAVPSVRG